MQFHSIIYLEVINKPNEQIIFSSCLNQYYNVHKSCCERYQRKSIEYRLYHFPDVRLPQCQVLKYQPSLQNYSIEQAKVFIELQVFHPISTSPIISIDKSTTLQYQKYASNDAIININFLEMQQKLYNPRKVFLPFIQGRFQIQLYIFDQENSAKKINFFFDATKFSGSVMMKYEERDFKVALSGMIEFKTIGQIQQETLYQFPQFNDVSEPIQMLNLKTLQCTLISQRKSAMTIKNQASIRKPQSHQNITPVQTPSPGPVDESPQFQPPFESFHLDEDLVQDEDLYSFEQIRGQVVCYLRSQHGSRIIQKYLSIINQPEIQMFINEIEPYLADLMMDPYANYVFGSLSQSCTPSQRAQIFKNISPRILEISCDKKGTHAVQSLISLISSSSEEEIVEKAIKDHILTLIFDCQGTHLIKKIIVRFSESKLVNLFAVLLKQFVKIANHQYGLCVLKDLMQRFKSNEDKIAIILEKLVVHIDEILQDPYGNYAVQHAIDLYGDKKCSSMIDRILQKIVQLSIHKYSSNVVEKCILETSKFTKERFFLILSNENICLELMKNKFGSFVLQKALNESERLNSHDLICSIKKNLQSIYTSNIRQKWLDYLDQFCRRCN